MKTIKEIKECPDCASTEIIHNPERQQVVCKECGLIYEELTPKEEEKYTGVQSDVFESSGKSKKARH